MNLKGFYDLLVSMHPSIEVLSRKLYWNNDYLIKRYNEKKNRVKEPSLKVGLSTIVSAISSLGIREGDILIVHSSYESFQKGCTDIVEPYKLIETLAGLIGDTGTLAFPTHPLYSKDKVSKQTIKYNDDIDEILTYNVRKTFAWTGFLPNLFLRMPGVVRSKHPINTLAASGPLASEMMRENIEGDCPLPCGTNSSWKFCADRRAKILGLGVDLVHSLTMVHVAEDCNPDWPIKEWYRKRTFKIIDGIDQQLLTVGERKPKWTINLAERCFRKDLIKEGILKIASVGELQIEYINDSKELIDYLNSKNANGYPYYFGRKLS